MKILLADDDVVLVDLLQFLFKREGFQVLTAFDGEAALRLILNQAPDIVMLDLKMPKRNGFEVLQQIQQKTRTPVIILTATEDEDTLVKVLTMGADDYIVKPFEPRELLARVQALLRRTATKTARPDKLAKPLVSTHIQLDRARHQVAVDGRPVLLSHNEFKVLEYLMERAGRIVPANELIANLWGYDSEVTGAVIKMTILRVRRKIEPHPSKPRYIVSVAGEGYMFDDNA